MSLKITIKAYKKVEDKITVDDVKPGMVFKYDNGITGLKLYDGEVVLLKYSHENNWLKISDGSMDYYGVEILGRLDEIIVVQNNG